MAPLTDSRSSLVSKLQNILHLHSSNHDLSSSEVLSVRNLTSQRLTLEVGKPASTRISSSQEAQTHDHFNGQLVVEPFTISSADTVNHNEKANGVSTIDAPSIPQVNGEVSIISSANIALNTPLSKPLTSIYDASTKFLTLYESPDLKCWMKDFRDDTSITALSIPGTHNSPTYHWALPSVRCQAVSPLEQLHNGVRFFDIRVQPHHPDNPSDDALHLVHGAFPISLIGSKKLRQLIDITDAFLAANPSETLIISLKREGVGKATDHQLASILHTHYAKDWYTEPRIPSLGEVRGKIVLMRRFGLPDQFKTEHNGKGWGLDAEAWADNTASDVHGQVCVQDFYEVLNTQLIPKKLEVSCAQFERAGAIVCPLPGAEGTGSPEQIYLNFLTASNFFNFRCWPENIAAKLNPAVTRFLCEKHSCGENGGDGGDGGLGIVVCDWVGKHGNWDLVKCIVGMNSRRLFRERGYGWNTPAKP